MKIDWIHIPLMFHPCLGKDTYSDSQHQGNCRHRRPAFDEVYTGKNHKAMENHHFSWVNHLL